MCKDLYSKVGLSFFSEKVNIKGLKTKSKSPVYLYPQVHNKASTDFQRSTQTKLSSTDPGPSHCFGQASSPNQPDQTDKVAVPAKSKQAALCRADESASWSQPRQQPEKCPRRTWWPPSRSSWPPRPRPWGSPRPAGWPRWFWESTPGARCSVSPWGADRRQVEKQSTIFALHIRGVCVSSFLIIRKSLTMTRYNSRDLLLPPPHKPSLIHMISPGQYRFECFFFISESVQVYLFINICLKRTTSKTLPQAQRTRDLSAFVQ